MNTKINENILTELFNDNLLRQNRFAQVVGMGLYRCAHLHDGRRYRADLAEPLHKDNENTNMREKAVNNEMKAHSKSLAEAAQMPEDLPTPEKSIRQIESEQKKRLSGK